MEEEARAAELRRAGVCARGKWVVFGQGIPVPGSGCGGQGGA